MPSDVIVEMRGIVKVYPDGVKALDGVDLRLRRGRVHAILGENGAGKTTLMRILYGEIKPTRGRIFIDGREHRIRDVREALRLGIAMVYQHPRMVPTLTIGDNIKLYFSSAGIPLSEVRGRLERAERLTGFKVPLDEVVSEAPLGLIQRAEILRSVAAGAKVLVLDEPTTNLTPHEVKGLFNAIRRLKEAGVSIAYITHRLPEVLEIADEVTILRKGRVVASELDVREVDEELLAKLMVGELPRVKGASKPRSRVLLRVRNLKVRGKLEVHVDELSVREGEILGVAGVEGNGQEELVRAVVGILKPVEGYIEFLGHRNPTISDFLRLGGSFIPGNRSEALLQDFTVADNIAFLMYSQGGPRILGPRRLSRLYQLVAARYKIVASSPWAPVKSLSGGNQQKLLVGSELARRPRFVVAVNPTRGLDVATTAYVRNLLVDVAESGGGVLLVSADLDEIMELSSRIAVMSRGRITGVLDRGEATPERIGRLMGGAA